MENVLYQLPEIGRLKVLPHQPMKRCPGCGIASRTWPYWLLKLLGIQNVAFRLTHCDGGLDPQVEMNTPFGKVEGTRVCAGIQTKHLHVVCSFCGTHLLMETYSK